MAFMKTTSSFSIGLGMGGEETIAAARRALLELGWPLLTQEPDRVTATEDVTRLHCHCQPIGVEVALAPAVDEQATLLIQASVPGRGPIASQHLREGTAVLARRIRSLSGPPG